VCGFASTNVNCTVSNTMAQLTAWFLGFSCLAGLICSLSMPSRQHSGKGAARCTGITATIFGIVSFGLTLYNLAKGQSRCDALSLPELCEKGHTAMIYAAVAAGCAFTSTLLWCYTK